MASEISSSNIYGYCTECKVKYKFIGYKSYVTNEKGIVQCPKCHEKRKVPVSWVRGLTPVPEMGLEISEKTNTEVRRR
ncbi:hypothetical protein D3C75_778730 [compost metagenome]